MFKRGFGTSCKVRKCINFEYWVFYFFCLVVCVYVCGWVGGLRMIGGLGINYSKGVLLGLLFLSG